MRIDYSEPKKSCRSPQPELNRPRKESSGGTFILVFITALLCLGIGFGGGWTLSQRSAKKAFKAAMEQQSLENSPQQAKVQPVPQQQAAAIPGQQALPADSGKQQPAAGSTQPTSDPPLSFYKTLPSGQKNNVLGSGINAKDDKPAKQPLQAAMPANLNRPSPPPGVEPVQKPQTQPAPAKQGSRPEASGFTVQVASYSLKSEAETLRNSLAAKGYNVGIVESHLGDKGTWYRVRVGKKLEGEAAKELAKKLGKGALAIPDKD